MKIKRYIFKCINKFIIKKISTRIFFFFFFFIVCRRFDFNCQSELIAFDKRYEDFKAKGVEVIGVSIDSVFTHNAWRNTAINDGGIGQIQYPLIADTTHAVIDAYDVADPNGPGIALRGSFLIDEDGVVRHQVINDGPLGRNIDEMLRMVDALSFHQTHGEVCPAQWEAGKAGMDASTKGVAAYLSEHTADLDK